MKQKRNRFLEFLRCFSFLCVMIFGLMTIVATGGGGGNSGSNPPGNNTNTPIPPKPNNIPDTVAAAWNEDKSAAVMVDDDGNIMVVKEDSISWKAPDGSSFVVYYEDNLPTRTVTDDEYIIIYSNWKENSVDIAIIYPTGNYEIHRDLVSSLSFDSESLSVSFGALSDVNLSIVLKRASQIVEIAKCSAGIYAAAQTGGVAWAAATLACESTILMVASQFTEEDNEFIENTENLFTALNIFEGCSGDPDDCVEILFNVGETLFIDSLETQENLESSIDDAEDELSGASLYNIEGVWNVRSVVTWVSDNAASNLIGTVTEDIVTFDRSGGGDILIENSRGSSQGIIDQDYDSFTIEVHGTVDLSSQGINAYVDALEIDSGEFINPDYIEGTAEFIVEKIYGPEASRVKMADTKSDFTMTRVSSGGETETGSIEGYITYEGDEPGYHILYVAIKDMNYKDILHKMVSFFGIPKESLEGDGYYYMVSKIPAGGPYLVVAYWDVNDNGHYDDDPIAYYRGTIVVSSGSEENGINIELEN